MPLKSLLRIEIKNRFKSHLFFLDVDTQVLIINNL